MVSLVITMTVIKMKAYTVVVFFALTLVSFRLAISSC